MNQQAGLTAQPQAPDRAHSRAGYWTWLTLILIAGAVQRGLILSDYLERHPLAQYPIVDARTYWDWAGRIAAGQWIGNEPFFSAPLYPYFLSLIRRCGGGFSTVYLIQAGLDLLSAALLAEIGRRIFQRAGAGLLAAGLFLAMLEPASFALRLLTSSLQMPLICVSWLTLVGARRNLTAGRATLAGAATGLLALAMPAAMYLLPVAAAWWWWNAGRSRAALGRAALGAACGFAVIAPATVHNYIATEGEFFPIQSVLGVNFRQGNGPGAEGIIIMIPGTSVDREELFRTAQVDLRRRLGREPSWREMDRFYVDEAVRYWREDWGRAIRLFGKKLYWFFTSANFGDIYQPTMDISEGFAPRLRLAPLQTAWLLPLALVTIVTWLACPNQRLMGLLFFVMPVAMVVAFWYSPRYRLTALPVVALAAGLALWRALDWRERRAGRWALAVALAICAGGALQIWNARRGFDSLDIWRPQYYETIATAEMSQGRDQAALQHFEKALSLNSGLLKSRAGIAELRARAGDPLTGLHMLQTAAAAAPDDANLQDQLARALARMDRLSEAMPHFQRAVELSPSTAKLRNNYGVALRLSDRHDEARAQFIAALEIDPTYAEAHMNMGYEALDAGDLDEALARFEKAARTNPNMIDAYLRMASIHQARRDWPEVLRSLREAARRAPDERRVSAELAWQLATAPGLNQTDRAEALRLAQRLASGPMAPGDLDTLAAAQAANGRFEDAARTARRAAEQARAVGDREAAARYESRAALYADRRPYVAE